jgi:hypothetical protein
MQLEEHHGKSLRMEMASVTTDEKIRLQRKNSFALFDNMNTITTVSNINIIIGDGSAAS